MSTVFPRHAGWNSVPRLGSVLCQNETPIRLKPYPDYDEAETIDSIKPLRPTSDDPVDNFGYINDVHIMFYGNSPLFPVVTRCFELLDEHLDLDEYRGNFEHRCRTLYYDLLRLFLPVYNYKTLHDIEIQEYCDWIYEIFQKWLYVSRFEWPKTDNDIRQNLQTRASDMRNLLSRLRCT